MNRNAFLPHLDRVSIERAYRKAAGNELDSGKILSPESSAALVANAFGFFIDVPQRLPPLPGTEDFGWPAASVQLEASVRFPWRGGRHPWLDVLVETDSYLIGIESKRFEPFRSGKKPSLSEAYWRKVWGQQMTQVEAMRDSLRGGDVSLDALDATQLVKHMFGLRSECHRREPLKKSVLIYLYAEPTSWPDGRSIDSSQRERHATCVGRFAARIAGAEVGFYPLTYTRLLASWAASPNLALRRHADAMDRHFSPL